MSTASNTPDRDRDRVTRSPDTAAERPSSTHADAAAKLVSGVARAAAPREAAAAPKESTDIPAHKMGQPPPPGREDENPRAFQRNFAPDVRLSPEKRAELAAKYA